jgi:osmotically-inducible protein OsmY
MTKSNALTWDVTVPEGIEAVASNGNVALGGIVSYGAQRAAAERAVAGLTGVRNIKDEIVVDWDADPVDVSALVQDALDRHALFTDDIDITG